MAACAVSGLFDIEATRFFEARTATTSVDRSSAELVGTSAEEVTSSELGGEL